MKHLMVGLILISAIALAVKGNEYHVEIGIQRDEFKPFLEKLKAIMQTGNDTLGIPILDPFTMDQIPIALHEGMINMDALLNNIRVDGLSTYDVNKGDFEFGLTKLKLTMNLSWPLIFANADYDMKGKVDDFQIYGKGKMKISPQDFSFDVIINFKIDGSYLQAKDMELKISLGALDFHATGLYNDDEISDVLSAVISDMAPQLITDYHDMITEKANPLIMNFLNKYLCTMTIQELLKLIGIGK